MEEHASKMKPWEQHHAIISMPRYAYNPTTLMQQSAGFLVTCTFRREKSATKEILGLIQEYMKLTATDLRQDNPVINGIEKNGQIHNQPAEVEQGPPESALCSAKTLPLSFPKGELEISSEDSKVLETGDSAEGSITKEGRSCAILPRQQDSGRHGEGEDNRPEEVEALSENSKIVETGRGNIVEVVFSHIGKQDSVRHVEGEDKRLSQSGRANDAHGVEALKEKSKLEIGRVKDVEDSIRERSGVAACECYEDNERHDEGEDQVLSQSGVRSSPHGEEMMTQNTVDIDLILVKLATMGVIYICASGKPPCSVLNVASRLLKDVQAGTRAAPQWCHRLVPVQATCSTNREELQAVVSQLVKDHLRDHHVPAGEQPLKYAVAFNRRGATVAAKDSSEEIFMLGRDECIKIVTAAVEEVIKPVRVDLTSPQMVVIVELIPVAGAQSCLMCAVSVLPGDLTVSKPKLNVKPLASLYPKSRKRKHPK